MKKIFLVLLLTVFSFSLSGCYKKDVNKEAETEMPALSEDDSLEVIEEELDDTELEEFEAELDALDEEINQL